MDGHNGGDVASESDARTVNNSGNTMRHNYRVLSDNEKEAMVAIKDKGAAFLTFLNELDLDAQPDPRCMALARTKIEEAVMWAVKGLTA